MKVNFITIIALHSFVIIILCSVNQLIIKVKFSKIKYNQISNPQLNYILLKIPKKIN